MRAVYVCHAYAGDPVRNELRVAEIAERIARAGDLPLAPQLYVPNFLSEQKDRALALSLCLALIAKADEVRVYGKPTDGMKKEIAEAHRLGIPVTSEEDR